MMATQLDQNSFLYGANATFIAELYERYLENPASVDPSWASFFAGMADDARGVSKDLSGPSWTKARSQVIGVVEPTLPPAKGAKPTNGAANGAAAPAAGPASLNDPGVRAAAKDTFRALLLIRAYRTRGHLEADLDPLGITAAKKQAELDPETYGFTAADMDRPIFIDNMIGPGEVLTLREIIARLRATYCGKIGVEFMHIQDMEQRLWLQDRIEGGLNHTEFTVKGKRAIYERVVAAEALEQFLDKKYTGTKRFGLEGGESMIPALEQILKRGGQLGVQEVVIGMPHRGRLNVLGNFMKKRFAAIFSEFQGNPANPDDVQGSGDVKYHLGTSADREFDGNVVHLSLNANPSHLEVVDPVVVGRVRAKQQQRGDTDRTQVMGLLMHGDAAFAGQGLVAETLALSELRGYRTGGTIHFIVNNQIGFTTAPAYSRFTPYPSDVAMMVQAPIFHVNGDDPEAVVHVARVATEFRQRFRRDVVIDMICYRRHGHNEGDEPAYTQPQMYKNIATQKTTRELYAEQLVREGVMTAQEGQAVYDAFIADLQAEFDAAPSYKPNKADWLEGKWSGLSTAPDDDRRGVTAVSESALRQVGEALVKWPEGFNINRKLVRQLEAKRQMFATGEGFDWATAEALAFGTLLLEGVPVRLSGQDSGRGTFSQRHSVLIDQETEARYVPLNNIAAGQSSYEVIDSPLAEASVLGFEYGFSLTEPNALVLWEAQFGDFVNGAQVIIDQFIVSAETKWLRMSGLVMLLPHGHEGAGPEHSSARPERFLQLCAEDNIQVVNCTTPANYFHALRRQMKRSFRKPLIVLTPKSLLRAKACQSSLKDFVEGSSFHRILPETEKLVADKKVRRVVLCTGKVYYDIVAEREKREIKDVAVVRIEQLYPFPHQKLGETLSRYSNAEVVWAQEEPENMGYWFFVDRRIEKALAGLDIKAKRPGYVGRISAASPATGLLRRHNKEQAELVDAALRVG
jgi:2-oxoglutarate dehydrogenase E1 component